MATFRLLHFSKVQLLKRLAPGLLYEFLTPFSQILENRGVVLSPEALDYEGLVGAFMNPDGESAPLAEALYIVDEMATPDGMDALLAAAESAGISLDGGGDLTPEEVALRVWLADRSLIERKHAESLLIRVRSFEYSLANAFPPPAFESPTEEVLEELEQDLDGWFESKKRGRGSRVLIFPKDDGVWFLVRHGEPLRREGTMDGGERSIVVFRPEKFNVLVYLPATGELGINAPFSPNGRARSPPRHLESHMRSNQSRFLWWRRSRESSILASLSCQRTNLS